MKRIIGLFILILLALSSIAMAGESKVYEVEGYFTANFPAELKLNKSDKYHSLSTWTKDGFVDINASPIEQSLDDYMADMQARSPYSSLIDNGNTYIDNREARWVLFSYQEPMPSPKRYFLIYVTYSDTHCYSFTFMGLYDKLDSDHVFIDDVLSSFKILR